jgi:uncharacterized protein (TIGR02246 family)
MLRNTTLGLCLALAAVAAACKSTPPPTPPDTRAADVQAVKDVEAAWLKDVATKDAGKYASYFADDGCALYPGAATTCGREAIKALVTTYYADPNFSFTLQDTRAVASKGGDMVFTQGTYSMTVTNPKTKKSVTDKGKYVTIYMKQADGSWKAAVDTSNSDSQM